MTFNMVNYNIRVVLSYSQQNLVSDYILESVMFSVIPLEMVEQLGYKNSIEKTLYSSFGYDQWYVIPTHQGNGVSGAVLFLKEIEEAENEKLVIPVVVTCSKNKTPKNVKIQYKFSLEPGDAYQLCLSMREDNKSCFGDMVLQTEETFSTDMRLFVVFSVMNRGEKGPSDMSKLEFDVNPALTKTHQEVLKKVFRAHQKVFAMSLKDGAELKAEPYVIQLKNETKPIRVTPRIAPYEANKWFKEYIEQLLDLWLMERCHGSWAAGVILVPSDIEQRSPRGRKVMKLKRAPRFKVN
ncbi:uncharacterized protein EV154DRAFT_482868 [Mucor mucedo]|uniref:uncharacterized protein n=1 Tax=Mucor mucedo TaxID=29922 RepID=UPI002220EB72|nr:uncharacterized protein EV154DRAFT_482868 [Mucor mucedo]KAI7889751.1 hypothetical protein EV154DRAFT_482868 [Mucor mucedo]